MKNKTMYCMYVYSVCVPFTRVSDFIRANEKWNAADVNVVLLRRKQHEITPSPSFPLSLPPSSHCCTIVPFPGIVFLSHTRFRGLPVT